MTKVIYRADEFGRVKTEQYTQTRLSDGQITLDYSEHYETRPQRVTHRVVRDADAEVPAAESEPPLVMVTSSDEDETEEQSEDSDSKTNSKEEEVLTEEEKKGSVCCSRNYFFGDINFRDVKFIFGQNLISFSKIQFKKILFHILGS